jgi:tetratricopeptide (TPR) repeat protein
VNHRTEAFKAFQRRLDKLEPAMEAWQAEFPDLDADGLNRTLVEYARSGSYAIRYIPLAPWSGSTDVRVLSDAEVHGVFAYLYAYVHPPGEPTNLPAARDEIDEALRADSSALDASAMAFYTPELGIVTSRPELARRVVAGHPESWLAWQMVADATRPGDPAKLTALTRALELAPDQPEALTRMATLKAGVGNWEEALSLSAEALRARAVTTGVWMIHLAALAHTGHCPEAALWAAAMTRYLAPAHAGVVVAQAWEGLKVVCASRNDPSPPAR